MTWTHNLGRWLGLIFALVFGALGYLVWQIGMDVATALDAVEGLSFFGLPLAEVLPHGQWVLLLDRAPWPVLKKRSETRGLCKGMWYARSPEVVDSTAMETRARIRVPGDILYGEP